MTDVRDSHGDLLGDGDAVMMLKDLRVDGTSLTLKRAAMAKSIRLTDDTEAIECGADELAGPVLKTCFPKQA